VTEVANQTLQQSQLSAENAEAALKSKEQKLLQLNDEIAQAQAKLDEVSLKNHELSATSDLWEETNAEQEKHNKLLKTSFTSLSERVTAMKAEANNQAEVDQQTRDDLAKRAKALDAREEVLRRRERHVTESERIVQDNANLLNL
jgi:chromosome segregation ATPase